MNTDQGFIHFSRSQASALFVLIAISAMLIIGTEAARAETFTLDGVTAESSAAVGAEGGCSMVPAEDGTYPCFSTKAKRSEAASKAMSEGKVPPGSTAIPPKDRQATSSGRKARAAYVCDGATQVWTSTYKTGSYGWFDYIPNWRNFSSTFNNTISSDWTSSYYSAFYHDGVNGSGHFFDKAKSNCHLDNALTSDAFPGGGTWNDKFTSFLDI